ncbi:MAG: hypothetical protein E6Z12_00950 [Finegoldia magna]|nr:hypothetical protein [Finegoldia magna]MDU5969875.1 hypothetical protein [Finegoldia magna]
MTIIERITYLETMDMVRDQRIKELQVAVEELSRCVMGGVNHESNDSNE